MKLKGKLGILVLLVALIIVVLYFLPRYDVLVNFYDAFLFYPIQSARIFILGIAPFSIGDVLYVVGGTLLLWTLIRWVKYIIKFRTHKQVLAASVLRTINIALLVYLWFVLGWGANYYKQPLRKYWNLSYGNGSIQSQDTSLQARRVRRAQDSTAMVAFNAYLVDRLNATAPYYRTLSFKEINSRAKAYYRTYTDSKVRMHGLDIKPTLFGYFMERIAVDGYYNPFTGEGQVDKDQPAFVMPFIVCHEMAHQAGIAAEDDANLMAYALGTMAGDSTFNYSAYLNIWLYANSRLYRRDSVLALQFEKKLNKLTTAHIDTLEQLSARYHNEVARYSNEVYDSYLRMQNQKDGIRSYGNVATSAWQLELIRGVKGLEKIHVP